LNNGNGNGARARPAAKSQNEEVRLPEVHEIFLEGVGLVFHDGQTGDRKRFSLGFMRFAAPNTTDPMQVGANGTYNDFYFELEADSGAAAALGRRGVQFPVDIYLKLGATPTMINLRGRFGNMLAGRDYDLTVTAATDEIAEVADFARDAHVATFQLPKLGPLKATAEVKDAAPPSTGGAGGQPAITALKLEAGRPDLLLLKADGTMRDPLQLRGAALDVSAEGNQIAALSGLVLPGLPQGIPQLPPLGPYKLAVNLAETRDRRPTLPKVRLDLGRDDLLKLTVDGSIADPLDHKGFALTLAADAADLAAVAREFNLTSPLDGPLKLDGKITDSGPERYALTGLKLEGAGSDIGGSMTVSLAGPKPAITADLSSAMIDAAKLLPKKPQPAKPSAKAAPPPAVGDGRLFPADPLPFDLLAAAEADIKYRAEAIRTPRGPQFRGTAAQAALHDGVLQLRPLTTAIAGGAISGDLAMDAKTGAVAGRLSVKGVDLGKIDEEVPGGELVTGGKTDADFELHGTGKSVRAIMAGLDGSLLLAVGPAAFKARYADILGFEGLFNIVNKSLPPVEETHLNCLVTRFDIANGLATSRIAVADTQRLNLDGSGTINLKTEELDLTFDSTTKVTSLLSLMPPIHAGGTLANPDFEPDIGAGAVGALGNVLNDLLNPGNVLGEIFGSGKKKTVCEVALEKATGKALGAAPSTAQPAAAPQARPERPQARPGSGDRVKDAGQAIERNLRNIFGK